MPQVPVHLLLVEDNPGDVLLIRESLRQCSVAVDVTIAQDGTQAVALLSAAFKADLIILDLTIPRLDGYPVLERINPSIAPVVVFTWRVKGSDRALALGAREVVQKPSDFSTFVQAVCRIVETWGRSSGANGVGASN